MDKLLTIRGRLYLGFAAIIGILTIAIVITSLKIYSIKKTAIIWNQDVVLYDNTANLNIHLYRLYSAIMATNTENTMNEQLSQLDINTELDAINKKTTTISNQINASRPELAAQWQQILTLLHNMQNARSKLNNMNYATLEQQILPTLQQILVLMDQDSKIDNTTTSGFLEVQLTNLSLYSAHTSNNISVIERTIYTLLFISILMSIIIVYFTIRSIINYIDIIRQHSNRIAKGDLTKRLAVRSYDEMGSLTEDLNSMTDSLVKMTQLINESSQNMVTSLAEVKQSASFQSSGASEQATSINEITSSLAEIEKSSTQTNEKAKSLGENSERTRARGQQGLESVEQSINGMKVVREKVQAIAQTILELSKQTQQIGEITAVVNNLAQQSKMLALNASIEAVKAGDAGKGFSVVATEVKNLAEQSEQSTTQVQKILENIRHTAEKAVMVTEEGTKEVDIGTNLVEQTGDIMKSLTEVIYETSLAAQQIEAAIRQENVGIEQITIGMNEINQVTSSFVASTKQTMEAIENLSLIAKEIKEYIDTYKI